MKTKLIILLCLLGTSVWAQNTHILPTPQQVEFQQGTFVWQDNRVESKLVSHLEVPRNEDQAYRLTISKKGVVMEATTEVGLFYAEQSLKQLRRYATLTDTEIPCVTILDWPDFKLRGWQDDISRGPIVSMEYLKRLIPQMAECKVNFFTLYTEHTFRTKSHPDVAPANAFTAEELQELERLCDSYHIQLIGNQQCFAHFEEILKSPFYEELADALDNLNPADEGSYEFLEDLIREEAQVYHSQLFNINCDETESLGSGKASAYVDSIGSATAYFRHINRVNEIVKRHGKRAMMWGDIADQHPEIIQNLDPDIILLAWTYAARDSYDAFLQPYADSGHEFMVAPGVSLSSRVWPYRHDYQSNIPHLCRDGFHKGAFGVMNTCWDDFGESLINTALYGLALGAEMSWNPIKSTEVAKADNEEEQREIRRNFSVHFLGDTDPTTSLVQALDAVASLSELNDLGRFSVMWEPMTPFYPSQVGDSMKAHYQSILDEELHYGPLKAGTEFFLKHYKSNAQWNADLIDNALYALHRIEWCLRRNIARCQLHQTYLEPTESNIQESKQQVDSLFAGLHRLKQAYIQLWEQECRPYWLDVNMKKYDDAARELQTLPYLPFIESGSDENGKVVITLNTLYHDQPIHYTLDGKEVTLDDPVYHQPITLERSGLVKACCFDDRGRGVRAERYFLYHKGMGKLRKLNSVPGNYRPEYSGGGDNALIDGHLGGNDYKDGRWQGFYGVDADIELDFKRIEDIQGLEIGFLVNPYDWILKANEVEIYTSTDGKDYRLLQRHEIRNQVDPKGNWIFRETIPFNKLSTRFLRIVVKNPGLIPEGLPGHGYDSWIFMDELIIK